METLGFAIQVIGLIIMIIGGLWLLIEGFQESIIWGIAMICFNIISLLFVILYWERAKYPFLIQVGGFAIMFIGGLISGSFIFTDR